MTKIQALRATGLDLMSEDHCIHLYEPGEAGQLSSTALDRVPRKVQGREIIATERDMPAETYDDVNVRQLLRIGTVGEVAERAASARKSGGSKGQWARDAHEVLQILEAGGYRFADVDEWIDISSQLRTAITTSEYFGSKAWRSVELPQPRFADVMETEVWNCTVLSATQTLARAPGCAWPVGALNFASARNPGGGFSTGAAAQEESIARSSGLYPCLTKHFESFFVPSRRAKAGVYTHDIIYSPAVPVVRDDEGRLLGEPYSVDFLTAAAPNVGAMQRDLGKRAREVAQLELRERIARVMELFARRGAEELVLGAWGCGVFRNDPWVVARLFAQQLRGRCRGQFRRVVFAVLDASMAAAFGDVFRTEVLPPSSGGSIRGAQRRWGECTATPPE